MPASHGQRIYAALMTQKQVKGRSLCSDEIIIICEQQVGIFREEWGREGRAKKKVELTDAEWVASLEGEPHLKGINVKSEIAACQLWYRTNISKTGGPTRRRIVNWLNKSERTFELKAGGAQYASGLKPLPPMPPEPPFWRETFPDFLHIDKPWPEIDRTAQIYIAEQMAQRKRA